MNKKLLFRFVALVAAMMCALGASAYDFVSGNVYYSITGTNTVEVSPRSQSGGNYSGAVTIPSTVTNGGKTYTVTAVGPGAFTSCYDLTSVQLPSTLDSIGETAFYYCTGLKSLTIPEGVKRIAGWNIYCIDSLWSVDLPSTLQSIEGQCFSSLPKLTSLTCRATTPPTTVSSFYNMSFNDCILYVPEGSIGAYQVATNWKRFTNIQAIDKDPEALYDFTVDGIYYGYGYDSSVGGYGPGSDHVRVLPKDDNYNSYTGQVIIPATVTYGGKTYTVQIIDIGAFKLSTGLTAVSIPNTLNWIGGQAFAGCTALTKVYCDATMPPTLGSNTFDTSHYTSVTLTVPKGCKSAYQAATNWKNFTNIVEGAYDFLEGGIYYNITGSNTAEVTYRNTLYATYYGQVTVPSTVTHDGVTYNVTGIGNLAFYNSVNLTGLTLPNTITSLGDGAFARCENLPWLVIPRNVTSIPNSCCYGCYRMTDVTIPPSATSIGTYAFNECSNLTTVVVPNAVTTIGERAFDVCTGLKNMTLGTGVTSIGDYACMFSDFEHLISRATVPPTIGSHTFAAPDVQELIVPRGSVNAYRNADNWKQISTVKAIGDYLADEAGVDKDKFTLDSYGDYLWTVVDYTTSMVLRSGNRTIHSSNSVLTATVNVDKTSTLSFDFRALGEGSTSNPYDKSVFTIDGVQQFRYGNLEEVNYMFENQFSIDLAPGTHILEWSYTKDGSVSSAYDFFEIKNLRLSPSLNAALNVEGGNIQFVSTGDYPWTVAEEGSRQYAMSGNAGVKSSSSTVTATVTAKAGDVLSFDFKAWGEGSSTIWDKCSFSINGEEQTAYGAYQNTEWETYSVNLPAGECTLTWSYSKDSSVNPSGDYFAIDNVAITAGFTRGDVNGDGNVDVEDVTLLIAAVLGNATVGQAVGDVNNDTVVDVEDVTTLITRVLTGQF